VDALTRIAAGEFEAITSVVALVGDDVVCEAYFDGDAATLPTRRLRLACPARSPRPRAFRALEQ
jgi:hypothetical protein